MGKTTTMGREKFIKLVSGGIDSYILSQEYAGKNIYVDFGQSYALEEQKALRKLGVNYTLLRITAENINQGIYIPNRNLAMAAVVSMTYDPDIIYMAGLADDNCIDKTEIEFERMSEILSRYAGHKVEVKSPYWNRTKGEIVYYFSKKEKLKNTFSCYNPQNGQPCGNCPACLRRTIALETNGIDSGVQLSDEIIQTYLHKIHTYHPDRISRFFIWLNWHGGVGAIDIDGVLCNSKGKKINALENFNLSEKYKVLYTSRLECDRKITERWLKENSIKYDALIMNKLPYSKLIDDRAICIK